MSRRATAPLVILSVAALVGPGCAWERQDLTDDGDDAAWLRLVDTVPVDGGEVSDPLAPVDFCFSRRIDPRSLGAFDGTLGSGETIFDSAFDLQLFAWRAPGSASEAADGRWCPGSVLSVRPRSPLKDGVRYRVRLRPSAIGWAGEPLDLDDPRWLQLDDGSWATQVEFTVRLPPAPTPMPAPDDPPITLGDLFTAGGPFDRQRDLCSCHAEGEGLARQRLDLGDPAVAFASLVLDTAPRSTGFPLVTAGDPSESFLIHKLLRADDGGPLHAVRGAAMPMDGPLDDADMVAIARWIDDGAEP